LTTGTSAKTSVPRELEIQLDNVGAAMSIADANPVARIVREFVNPSLASVILGEPLIRPPIAITLLPRKAHLVALEAIQSRIIHSASERRLIRVRLGVHIGDFNEMALVKSSRIAPSATRTTQPDSDAPASRWGYGRNRETARTQRGAAAKSRRTDRRRDVAACQRDC